MKKATSALMAAALLLFQVHAEAACAGPAGNAGTFIYNTASHVPQFCDGTNWNALGKVPGAGGSGCTGPAGIDGDVIYNTDFHVSQYCDGASWRPMGKVPGAGGAGCTAPTAGEGKMIYNSAYSVAQYCDGASWVALAQGPTISAITFTNQTAVAPGATITSNAVGIAGQLTNVTAACGSGCTAISINGGAFVAGPVAGVNSGDTIAIRLTSSASKLTPVSATVIVGPTTSAPWTATTFTVDDFNFTHQTGVAPGTTITSDAVALSGGFTNRTASCGAGCTAISINGGAFVAGPVSGVNSGDTIAIRQTSSASYLTLTSATVLVWTTTSASWNATTGSGVVSAFNFADRSPGSGSPFTSDTVMLTGGFVNMTATCNAGCTAISINGGAFVAGPVSGVNSGNTIAIRQTLTAEPCTGGTSSGATTTASVTVGATTSSAWSVTTPAAIQTFTANGTWTKMTTCPPTTRIRAQCWGGGGGGSWKVTVGGGGGSGAAYATELGVLADYPVTVTVQVGAGGGAGGEPAGSGGDSSFSVAVAGGGRGASNYLGASTVGTAGNASGGTGYNGGAGGGGAWSGGTNGGGGGGAANLGGTGGAGGGSNGVAGIAGSGGGSGGAGGSGGTSGLNGVPGNIYGGGGGGGSTSAGKTGGAGAGGICIVTTDSAISFTTLTFKNQTNAIPSSIITSDVKTLGSGLTNVTATCGGSCTAISINGGAFVAGPVTGVNSGNTIAIRQTSSASGNAVTTAQVTVGAITSDAWQVQTGNVDAFSFPALSMVARNSTITSDAVTLSGGFTGQTAACLAGCTAISINGGAFVAGPVTGVNSGDAIAIRQTSSASGNAVTTAQVRVGATSSSAWSVLTACQGNCTYTTPGTVVYTLGPACSSMTVKLWSGGGGGGSGGIGGGVSGAGGFSSGTISGLTPSSTYNVVVASGGVGGGPCFGGTAGTGGAGAGGQASCGYAANDGGGGAGGGASRISDLGSVTIFVAGGGGGASGGTAGTGHNGGGGGGASGANGVASCGAGGTNAGGGTQTAGGARDPALSGSQASVDGGLGTGGKGAWAWSTAGSGGGGGGGGYYGGGGGGSAAAATACGGGGGGGGSSYIGGGGYSVSATSMASGNNTNPGGTGDPSYQAGVGTVSASVVNGGTAGNGGAGLVVITCP